MQNHWHLISAPAIGFTHDLFISLHPTNHHHHHHHHDDHHHFIVVKPELVYFVEFVDLFTQLGGADSSLPHCFQCQLILKLVGS